MDRERQVTFDGRRWSNADSDRIEIVEPDPAWPVAFRSEARRIRETLAPELRPRIEHVGSTAVPGTPAKPIIDILLILPPAADRTKLIAPLERLDYAFWEENPRPDRMFFVKGMPPFGRRRTHHVHVRPPQEVREMLLFRDHLTRNPRARARYGALKREVARRHPTDREAYTEAKRRFVEAVLEEARNP